MTFLDALKPFVSNRFLSSHGLFGSPIFEGNKNDLRFFMSYVVTASIFVATSKRLKKVFQNACRAG